MSTAFQQKSDSLQTENYGDHVENYQQENSLYELKSAGLADQLYSVVYYEREYRDVDNVVYSDGYKYAPDGV